MESVIRKQGYMIVVCATNGFHRGNGVSTTGCGKQQPGGFLYTTGAKSVFLENNHSTLCINRGTSLAYSLYKYWP